MTEMDTARIHNSKLEELARELQMTREQSLAVSDRLANAELALKFYADPRNYKVVATPDFIEQCWVKDDSELPTNGTNTKLAGRRARDHFRTYDENFSYI